MANYGFKYIQGQSTPSSAVIAKNDEEAREKIAEFIAEVPGRQFVHGSVRMSEHRVVDDPSPALLVAKAFFAHKKEYPESVPADAMTPLQKRMQSGNV